MKDRNSMALSDALNMTPVPKLRMGMTYARGVRKYALKVVSRALIKLFYTEYDAFNMAEKHVDDGSIKTQFYNALNELEAK